MAEKIATRHAYGEALAEIGSDPKIVALDADVSSCTMSCMFAQKYPERFFNMGIAEANMIGAAAGLSTYGFTPFVHAFAMFMAGRGYDQIRNSICYPNLNVKCVGTHGGLSVGEDGATHQCVEDIALMRAIPNMTVICPADGIETSKAVQACVDTPGPVYIRIGRGFEPPCYESDNYTYEIGKAITMREGTDLTIICCGIAVLQAMNAARVLAETDGLSVRVINMHTIKPIDREAILKAVTDTRRILTIEEHNVIGGLGDAVGNVIAESGKGCVFKKHGLQDTVAAIGYAEDLYAYYGLEANGVVDKVRGMMGMECEPDEDWNDE